MGAYMSEKKYTKDHEWVSIENEIATIGISNHAQESLGDIVFIELPSVGNSVKAKDEICVVESGQRSKMSTVPGRAPRRRHWHLGACTAAW